MGAPLEGIKVVDLTQAMAGPCCTMILGDFGAEVIKIEPPKTGDMLRFWGPPFEGEIGSYFLMFNRNKKGMTLNLRDQRAKDIFHELAGQADVVVESFRPRVKRKLGIDYETLAKDNPGLIYTSISGFGQTGPYSGRPGFDPIAQGMSGLMSITGTKKSGPTRVGTAIGDYFTGVFAALGTMVALFERKTSGQGQMVDASLLETLVGCLGVQASTYLATNVRPEPQGNNHPVQSPYGSFKTKDSYINIAAGNQAMWERLAKAIGLEELIEDKRFLTVADRVQNRPALMELIEEKLVTRTSAQWLEVMDEASVASGPILYIDEVFKDPQVLHQEMLKTIDHPVLGRLRTTGFSANLNRTKADIYLPPPLLGEHNQEILSRLGYGESQVAELEKEGVI
jgi:crotonobetainyl-CoA:carnitine CoA-transferase CaiB-like acyl-CoA transferase